MKNLPSLREIYNATGIPDMIEGIRAHTREVRREQENFQRRLEWIVANEGLDGLEAREKREKEARRNRRNGPGR